MAFRAVVSVALVAGWLSVAQGSAEADIRCPAPATGVSAPSYRFLHVQFAVGEKNYVANQKIYQGDELWAELCMPNVFPRARTMLAGVDLYRTEAGRFKGGRCSTSSKAGKRCTKMTLINHQRAGYTVGHLDSGDAVPIWSPRMTFEGNPKGVCCANPLAPAKYQALIWGKPQEFDSGAKWKIIPYTINFEIRKR